MNTKLEIEDYLQDFLDVIEGFDEVLSDYDTGRMLEETYNNVMKMNTPTLTSLQEKNAPWNEEELPDKEFDCIVSQTLSKTTCITSNRYTCEDGKISTDDISWESVYCNQHYTPLGLIRVFERMLEKMHDEGSIEWKDYYHEFLDECKGWLEDELTVMEE